MVDHRWFVKSKCGQPIFRRPCITSSIDQNIKQVNLSTDVTRHCFHSRSFGLIDPWSIDDKCRSSAEGMTEGWLFFFSLDIIGRIGHFVTDFHFTNVLNRRTELVWFAFFDVAFSWLPFLFILQNRRICLVGRSPSSGRGLNLSVPSSVDHLEFLANVLCHTLFEARFDSFDAAV